MCQLLGMNCNVPTDIVFSFTGFQERGGRTDHHADGFGIGFFEDRACRLFVDTVSACESPVAQLVRTTPIRSRNVIAHIRKATRGRVALENTHPFVRELWGRHWLFAHNGTLEGDLPRARGRFRPVGDTDSEAAFCDLLNTLDVRFGDTEPPPANLEHAIDAWAATTAERGTFNFLLSNGARLYVRCATQLHHIVREAPFRRAHLADTDFEVDFAAVTTPADRVAVIATQPLTDNEAWTPMAAGEFAVFEDGRRVA
ncbi:MAG: class II glutamine amidotransferase [Burkholderiales bacterium]|jgi:glutamine amidotransferase|nr:class II glutamine amidotransferase [Burkholderiales bacterium]